MSHPPHRGYPVLMGLPVTLTACRQSPTPLPSRVTAYFACIELHPPVLTRSIAPHCMYKKVGSAEEAVRVCRGWWGAGDRLATFGYHPRWVVRANLVYTFNPTSLLYCSVFKRPPMCNMLGKGLKLSFRTRPGVRQASWNGVRASQAFYNLGILLGGVGSLRRELFLRIVGLRWRGFPGGTKEDPGYGVASTTG